MPGQSQESKLLLGLLCGEQGSEYWSHHLIPAVCINRKLELAAEAESDPRHSNKG